MFSVSSAVSSRSRCRQAKLIGFARLALLCSVLLAPGTTRAEACWGPWGAAGRIEPWWLKVSQICHPTAEAVFRAWIAVATVEDRGCYAGFDGYCFHYPKRWSGMTGAPARADLPGKCEEPSQAAEGQIIFCAYYEDGWTDKFPPTTGGPPGAWFAAHVLKVCPRGERFDSKSGVCRQVNETSVAGTPPPSCERGGLTRGNPIHPLTATKRQTWRFDGSLSALPIALTFDSASRPPYVDPSLLDDLAEPPPTLASPFLALSTHRRLRFNESGSRARVFRGDGYSIEFVRDSDGVYRSLSKSRLTLNGAAWTFSDVERATVERYSPGDGRLVSVHRVSGAAVEATYSDTSTLSADMPRTGLLARVQDNFGRQITFAYEMASAMALVSRVIGPEGPIASLTYDPLQRLSRVGFSDQTSISLVYSEHRLPYHLTGTINEKGLAIGKFPYAISGHVSGTAVNGQIDSFKVVQQQLPAIDSKQELTSDGRLLRTWSWMPGAPITIENPNGSTSGVSSTLINGSLYVSSQTQPAGSGCAASMSAMGYDVNGNVELEDDFNGNRVCRGWDLSRNLETSRVEGLSTGAVCGVVTATGAGLPLGARKVSTQWHPDWRLAARVAEPLRLTTKVYNGQPDPFAGGAVASCAPGGALLPDGKPIVVLCREVEQATTDANGAQGFAAGLQGGVPHRERRWTYNQWGQVLTARGPRTDVDDTTTYVYHGATTADYTMGDLQQVTNAAGQVTRYPRYDRHGQMLRSIDPNGIVTEHTYDLRQRLTSTTVGGRQTVYTYDPTGQLIELTLPDTTKFTYVWDDAQRLTKITDQAGNSVTYTLDNAGNRTKEEIKDPSGALARSITRAFDALGRAQRVTGAP
jgi:YD repeat-containing protein